MQLDRQHVLVQLLHFLLLISWLSQASAQVPTACVVNATKPQGRCCPVPEGFSQACGGPIRGRCLPILPNKEYTRLRPELEVDDRMWWPRRFFKFGCQCDARFWGFDCGECFFGWRGKNCEIRDVRLRRNIFTLSKVQQRRYKELTKMMRTKISPYSVLIERDPTKSDPIVQPKFVPASVHYWLVAVHRYASRHTLVHTAEQCKNNTKLDLNHGGPGFVTWHRYYTMLLERELHKLAVERYNWTSFALPYWDWTDATWCEVCHNELVGSPGECDNFGQRVHNESPFHHWDEFCSSPTRSKTGHCVSCHSQDHFNKLVRQWTNLKFPSRAEVEFALSRKFYYIPGEFSKSPQDLTSCSFSRCLEGHCGPVEFYGIAGTIHNKVHNSVHGSFCCAATAPNDPIFFLHHSQISRLVHIWQLRHRQPVQAMANVNTMPGHSRQDYMVGFYPPVRHEEVFTDSESLGFDYDTLELGEPVRQRLQSLELIPLPTLRHFMTCKPGFLHPEHRLHRQHFRDELEEFSRRYLSEL